MAPSPTYQNKKKIARQGGKLVNWPLEGGGERRSWGWKGTEKNSKSKNFACKGTKRRSLAKKGKLTGISGKKRKLKKNERRERH